MRSENFLLVALAAEKFACRPSGMVGLDDAVLALDFDLAAAARLVERERAALAAIGAGGEQDRVDEPPPAREQRW